MNDCTKEFVKEKEECDGKPTVQPVKVSFEAAESKGEPTAGVEEPTVGTRTLEPTVEPAVAEPTVAEPTVAEPTVVEPTVAEPSVAEPSVAEPTVVEPTVAESSVAEPTVVKSTVAEPTVVEPVVAEPTVPKPTVEPTAEPTAKPTTELTMAGSTKQPTVTEMTTEPTVAEMTAQPTLAETLAEMTTEPRVEAKLVHTTQQMLESTVEPTSKPTAEPALKPEARLEPTSDLMLESALKTTPEPTAEPTRKTIPEPTVPELTLKLEPMLKTTSEPTAEPTRKTITEPIPEPTVPELTLQLEPMLKTTSEPTAEPTRKTIPEPTVPELTLKLATEPFTELEPSITKPMDVLKEPTQNSEEPMEEQSQLSRRFLNDSPLPVVTTHPFHQLAGIPIRSSNRSVCTRLDFEDYSLPINEYIDTTSVDSSDFLMDLPLDKWPDGDCIPELDVPTVDNFVDELLDCSVEEGSFVMENHSLPSPSSMLKLIERELERNSVFMNEDLLATSKNHKSNSLGVKSFDQSKCFRQDVHSKKFPADGDFLEDGFVREKEDIFSRGAYELQKEIGSPSLGDFSESWDVNCLGHDKISSYSSSDGDEDNIIDFGCLDKFRFNVSLNTFDDEREGFKFLPPFEMYRWEPCSGVDSVVPLQEELLDDLLDTTFAFESFESELMKEEGDRGTFQLGLERMSDNGTKNMGVRGRENSFCCDGMGDVTVPCERNELDLDFVDYEKEEVMDFFYKEILDPERVTTSTPISTSTPATLISTPTSTTPIFTPIFTFTSTSTATSTYTSTTTFTFTTTSTSTSASTSTSTFTSSSTVISTSTSTSTTTSSTSISTSTSTSTATSSTSTSIPPSTSTSLSTSRSTATSTLAPIPTPFPPDLSQTKEPATNSHKQWYQRRVRGWGRGWGRGRSVLPEE
eukprot:TRINITY_DN9369_c0_g1_i18.p1 TRINITY_DN9369_c0_g1~~TRINITY_DN9369_c0_g1_i18.p1  ORF type:complete len:912 (-),score=250.86 TRINITY_DN9369_c0_g1_i18:525-3260(-)